jgi:hypothetical protein
VAAAQKKDGVDVIHRSRMDMKKMVFLKIVQGWFMIPLLFSAEVDPLKAVFQGLSRKTIPFAVKKNSVCVLILTGLVFN